MENNATVETVRAAYARFSRDELVLFLKVRNLPTAGSDADLASRLTKHDVHKYCFPKSVIAKDQQAVDSTVTASAMMSIAAPSSRGDRRPRSLDARSNAAAGPSTSRRTLQPSSTLPGLPLEILADIMDHVGDWELSRGVGVPTSLPVPVDWARANATDLAILSGNMSRILATDPTQLPPSRASVIAAIRFGNVDVLDFFLIQYPALYTWLFDDDGVVPIKASRHGRTNVLDWWMAAMEKRNTLVRPPSPGIICEAVNSASRGGQVVSLDWWINSGFKIEYTEAALEYASSKNHIAVLDWWKNQHLSRKLPLKVGRVMDVASLSGNVQVLEWWASSQIEFKYDRHALLHASCHNRVEVLQWWLDSGLQMIFDQDALAGATRHNRPAVLDWWDKSGLPIQYRMCDIEEALEDSIGGRGAAKEWWKSKGVDFNTSDKDWVKLQTL